MDKTLLSFDRRALRRASLAVVSVALLAACNTDTPLEPTAARIPTAAQPTVVPNGLGNLVWTTVTTEANKKILIGGAKFTVTGSRMSKTVIDNGQNDGDLTWGRLKLVGLQPGTFNVCEQIAPVGYVLSTQACHLLTVYANGTTTDEFTHLILPHVQFQVRNALNQAIGGATFTIKDGTNTAIIVVKDNDAKDIATALGNFTVRLPAAGSYWVCPTTPPAGYAFGSTACKYGFYQNGYYTNAGAFQVVPL